MLQFPSDSSTLSLLKWMCTSPTQPFVYVVAGVFSTSQKYTSSGFLLFKKLIAYYQGRYNEVILTSCWCSKI